MTNFERSTAAAAVLMATAIPAFAQTNFTTTMEMVIPEDVVVPENHILLQFQGMEGFYVVSYDDAAEICEIDDEDFAMIADDPTTGIIYCDKLMSMEMDDRQALIEEGRIVALSEFEGSDDDGDSGDDVEETAEDEANDDTNDNNFLDEDENDQEEEGVTGDDSADGEGDLGADTETEVGADAETGAGAELDADTEVDADDQTETNGN